MDPSPGLYMMVILAVIWFDESYYDKLREDNKMFPCYPEEYYRITGWIDY